jgi:hypothetical protein
MVLRSEQWRLILNNEGKTLTELDLNLYTPDHRFPGGDEDPTSTMSESCQAQRRRPHTSMWSS